MVDVMESMREIRTLARQVAAEQLRPGVERWDHDRAVDDGVLAQLAELGFFGMRVPEAFGGMEFDLPTYAAALEELAWGEAGVALILARATSAAELLLRHGSDAQKRRWLERFAGGDVIGCTAAVEAGGTPPRATRQPDGWRVQGSAHFVVNGARAGVCLLRVIADDAGGERVLIVATDTPGCTIAEREQTMGFRTVDVVTLAFDNVRVDDDGVLPPAAAAAITGIGRLSTAAIGLGIARAALDHALAYAAQREQFGQTLRSFEGIRLKLADMAVRTEAARALVAAAAANPSTLATAVAKIVASEAAMHVSTDAVQIFGGYGYMRDYPVEKLMRDAKGTEVLDGTNQQLRLLIAERLYSEGG